MRVFLPDQRLEFSYENYKGETSVRYVLFKGLDYGHNEWYPEDQWFLRCWDIKKNAFRSFALASINALEIEVLS